EIKGTALDVGTAQALSNDTGEINYTMPFETMVSRFSPGGLKGTLFYGPRTTTGLGIVSLGFSHPFPVVAMISAFLLLILSLIWRYVGASMAWTSVWSKPWFLAQLLALILLAIAHEANGLVPVLIESKSATMVITFVRWGIGYWVVVTGTAVLLCLDFLQSRPKTG
ncbi:MAG: hypothetical protein ACKO55_11245, partial [Bacteroidota bacterium]